MVFLVSDSFYIVELHFRFGYLLWSLTTFITPFLCVLLDNLDDHVARLDSFELDGSVRLDQILDLIMMPSSTFDV